MGHNNVVIDTTQGLIFFPHLTIQAKSASSRTSAKPQNVLFHDSITVPPMTTKTITAIVDHLSERNTTCTVTPVEKIIEAPSLIVPHSISTIFDKKVSSQSHHNNGITLYNQQKHTNCRFLRSHSGTIQVH